MTLTNPKSFCNIIFQKNKWIILFGNSARLSFSGTLNFLLIFRVWGFSYCHIKVFWGPCNVGGQDNNPISSSLNPSLPGRIKSPKILTDWKKKKEILKSEYILRMKGNGISMLLNIFFIKQKKITENFLAGIL